MYIYSSVGDLRIKFILMKLILADIIDILFIRIPIFAFSLGLA